MSKAELVGFLKEHLGMTDGELEGMKHKELVELAQASLE